MSSTCNSTGICEPEDTVEVWRTLMAVYQGAILFLSLIFNGTVCLLFYKKSHLLSVSNCFVLNLICCQLCMSLLVLPFSLFAVVSQDWVYDGHWCAAQGFFFTVVLVTQQLALLTISIDRNYAIMNSLRYPTVFTQTLCAALIGLSWLFSVIISIPPLLHSGMGEYSFHRNQFLCGLNWDKDMPYLLVFSVLTFALPVIIESFCYIKIFFAAVGHSKRSSKVRPMGNRRSRIVSVTASSSCDYRSDASTNSSDIDEGGKRNSIECKAVRTIFLIAAVYIACWVPYYIDCFLTLRNEARNPNFSAAAICFLFSSSILNPMIYAYMNRVTRREIARFVCGSSGMADGDEAFSTSMSTYAPAWVQNRIRSKSTAGVNTETMDTIVEETEVEDSVFCEPRSDRILHVARCKVCTTLKPSTVGGMAHCKHIVVQSEKCFEMQQHVTRTETKDIKNEESTHPKVKPEASTFEHSLKVDVATRNPTENSNGWGIVKPDRFKDERRRSSAKQVDLSYFAKGKRRRKRDCGSFLFFENVEDNSCTSSGTRQRRRRPQRYSVDHVQSISLDQLPGLMKFRFSVNESDLKNVNRLTLKSDFEFENKALDANAPRPKSSSEVLETLQTRNNEPGHTTNHWPSEVGLSVRTSVHQNNRPLIDVNLSKKQITLIKDTDSSATLNSKSLSNWSQPNYLRLNSAPARCEQYVTSLAEPALDKKSPDVPSDTWALPNEVHM